jgi:hypothetical protein
MRSARRTTIGTGVNLDQPSSPRPSSRPRRPIPAMFLTLRQFWGLTLFVKGKNQFLRLGKCENACMRIKACQSMRRPAPRLLPRLREPPHLLFFVHAGSSARQAIDSAAGQSGLSILRLRGTRWKGWWLTLQALWQEAYRLSVSGWIVS